jgi:hypothetical protein
MAGGKGRLTVEVLAFDDQVVYMLADEDEDLGDGTETISAIRAKWVIENAATLSEAAAKLRDFADELAQMEREGWQLIGPVTDDFACVRKIGA